MIGDRPSAKRQPGESFRRQTCNVVLFRERHNCLPRGCARSDA